MARAVDALGAPGLGLDFMMSLRNWLDSLLRRNRDIVIVAGDEEYHVDPSSVVTPLKQSGIRFLGEASGPDEDHFGDRIRDIYSKVLWECPEVSRAYLAYVSYGESDPIKALCLESSGKQDRELVNTLAMIFSMRHSQDTLDILFARREHVADLSMVCKPFYDRSTYRPASS